MVVHQLLHKEDNHKRAERKESAQLGCGGQSAQRRHIEQPPLEERTKQRGGGGELTADRCPRRARDAHCWWAEYKDRIASDIHAGREQCRKRGGERILGTKAPVQPPVEHGA